MACQFTKSSTSQISVFYIANSLLSLISIKMFQVSGYNPAKKIVHVGVMWLVSLPQQAFLC